MTPSVSAVIPAFQAARFLPDAIRSVLEQTVPVLECIVVDDGSTDDTASVARGFAADGAVQVITTVNQGVSRARNTGIAAASGGLIAFLDADDVWLPDKTERQLAALAASPGAVAAYGSIAVTDEHLNVRRVLDAPDPASAVRAVLLLAEAVPSLAQTGLVSAKVLREIGGFDPELSTSADADLLCRLAAVGPLVRVEGPVARYRCHDGQMHSDLAAFDRDMRRILEKTFATCDDAVLQELRRPARAALERVLAKSHARDGDIAVAGRHAFAALIADPASTARDLMEVVGRRVRRRS